MLWRSALRGAMSCSAVIAMDTTPALEDLALPKFLTVKDLAALTRRNEFTIYHWLKREPHRLPRPTRALGRVLFIESDVRAWINQLREAIAEETESPALARAPRKRGRPTKAQEIARRQAQAAQHDQQEAAA